MTFGGFNVGDRIRLRVGFRNNTPTKQRVDFYSSCLMFPPIGKFTNEKLLENVYFPLTSQYFTWLDPKSSKITDSSFNLINFDATRQDESYFYSKVGYIPPMKIGKSKLFITYKKYGSKDWDTYTDDIVIDYPSVKGSEVVKVGFTKSYHPFENRFPTKDDLGDYPTLDYIPQGFYVVWKMVKETFIDIAIGVIARTGYKYPLWIGHKYWITGLEGQILTFHYFFIPKPILSYGKDNPNYKPYVIVLFVNVGGKLGMAVAKIR